MRTNGNFILLYVLLTIAQLIFCNYLNMSQFVIFTLLPGLILCMPLGVNTIFCMLIAFVTGLTVDWLGDGLIGLNALALVPVALLRKPLVSSIFGHDMVERQGSFSIYKNGLFDCAGATVIVTCLFLLVYIIADGAGTRPFWFNLVRFLCSGIVSSILCLIVLNVFNPRERR